MEHELKQIHYYFHSEQYELRKEIFLIQCFHLRQLTSYLKITILKASKTTHTTHIWGLEHQNLSG